MGVLHKIIEFLRSSIKDRNKIQLGSIDFKTGKIKW